MQANTVLFMLSSRPLKLLFYNSKPLILEMLQSGVCMAKPMSYRICDQTPLRQNEIRVFARPNFQCLVLAMRHRQYLPWSLVLSGDR
jgi:hypothetical protein